MEAWGIRRSGGFEDLGALKALGPGGFGGLRALVACEIWRHMKDMGPYRSPEANRALKAKWAYGRMVGLYKLWMHGG